MMETENPVAATQQHVNILCAVCGISFPAYQTQSTICIRCLSQQVDITEGITKEAIINWCRYCKRYCGPPWITCDRESRQLLALCLKKLTGLKKVKLIDASFIWTEPHSRRLKIKITVQKEASSSTIQQSFISEFSVNHTACDDCKKTFTPHTWQAQVQVRQKVPHKKTFYALEQLILKNNAHRKTLNIKENKEGVDFFFNSKSNAETFIAFLQSNVPFKMKQSKQLVSANEHENEFNYKYVFSCEMPKISREDLVILPTALCKHVGGVNPLALCLRVTNVLHMIDPLTLHTFDINPNIFFQYESDIEIFPLKSNATEFMVNNIETNPKIASSLNSSAFTTVKDMKRKYAEVELVRTKDFSQVFTRTILGDILKYGDYVVGYDCASMMTLQEFMADYPNKTMPDVVLVRKIYPNKKKNKNRIWRLKRLNKEKEDTKIDEEKEDEDFDNFLDNVEDDPEMQKNMLIYKNEKVLQERERRKKEKEQRNKRIDEEEKKADEKRRMEERRREDLGIDSEEEEEMNQQEAKVLNMLVDMGIEDNQETVDKEAHKQVDDFIFAMGQLSVEPKVEKNFEKIYKPRKNKK